MLRSLSCSRANPGALPRPCFSLGDAAMYGKERIVVSGLGLVAPVGRSLPEAWDNICHGRSGIAEATQYPLEGHACRSTATVPPYQLTKLQAPKNQKFMSPAVRHLMQAAYEALNHAGVRMESVDRDRMAIYTGSGQIGPEPSEFFKAFS